MQPFQLSSAQIVVSGAGFFREFYAVFTLPAEPYPNNGPPPPSNQTFAELPPAAPVPPRARHGSNTSALAVWGIPTASAAIRSFRHGPKTAPSPQSPRKPARPAQKGSASSRLLAARARASLPPGSPPKSPHSSRPATAAPDDAARARHSPFRSR